MTTPPTPDSKPSPEFMARCLPLMRAWEAGALSFAQASEQFAVLKREAVEAEHPANQGQVEIMLGVMQGYRSNLDISIEHFQAARRLFEQAGNPERVLLCDTNIAEAYRTKGNHTRARQLFSAAYETARQSNNVRIQAVCKVNEGQMALAQGYPNLARPPLEEGAWLAARVPEELRLNIIGLVCEIHRDLTTIYLAQGEERLAWEEAQKALASADESNHRLRQGQARRALAEVLTQLGAPPEGFDDITPDPDAYFQSAMEAFRELKAEGEIAQTLCAHALSLAKRGQPMTGARKAQQAMLIFTRLGMVNDAARAADIQMKMLAATQEE